MNEYSLGVIVLARFNSFRLPGKALIKIEGKELLGHVIDRLATVFDLGQIVVATSNERTDDPIAEYVANRGCALFRGSLEKVGERFYGAAVQYKFKYAVRINGDNVFVDPYMVKIMATEAVKSGVDFLSNVRNRTYPKGMSVEIVKLEYYRRHLQLISLDSYYNEHVMAYFYEVPSDNHLYVFNTELPEAVGINLSLDDSDDLNRTSWMMKRLDTALDMQSTVKTYIDYEKTL